MAKYVDVEKVFCADCEDRDRCDSPDLFCDVHSMPAEDVVPVVHGEWEEYPDWSHLRCTNCKIEFERIKMPSTRHYCPNCGADMRERKKNNE